jgi:hypothetical protein
MEKLFWGDYKVDELDINEEYVKKMVFNRILLTNNPIKEFLKYNPQDVKKFLDEFKTNFNKEFLERRVKVLRKVLFDEDIEVRELEWR